MPTRAQILDRLHAHTARCGVVTTAWLTKNDPVAYRGVLAHFGGIVAARQALGTARPSQHSWSEPRVINELRQLHRGRRVRITTSGLRAAGHHMLLAAVYKFVGSIGRARRLARIPEPGYQPVDREQWDEDRVISEIRARRRAGSTLSASKVPSRLYRAARLHCGSWQAAIELADLDYDEVRLNRRPWTRQEVLAWVKRAARKHMQNRSGPTMTVLVAPVGRPMREFFGDLEGALRAANLDPARVMQRRRRERRSEAALVAELRAEVKKRSVLTGTAFFSTRLGREAVARFGSWRAAIDRIGPDYGRRGATRPYRRPRRSSPGCRRDIVKGLLWALTRSSARSRSSPMQPSSTSARGDVRWRLPDWARSSAAALAQFVPLGRDRENWLGFSHSRRRASGPASASRSPATGRARSTSPATDAAIGDRPSAGAPTRAGQGRSAARQHRSTPGRAPQNSRRPGRTAVARAPNLAPRRGLMSSPTSRRPAHRSSPPGRALVAKPRPP